MFVRLLALLTFSFSVGASTLDIDTVEVMVTDGSPSQKLHMNKLPQVLSQMTIPADWQLIGHTAFEPDNTRQPNEHTTSYFRHPHKGKAVEAQATAILQKAGYKLFQNDDGPYSQGGFVPHNFEKEDDQPWLWCHDRLGMLTLKVAPYTHGTILIIGNEPLSPVMPNCQMPQPLMGNMFTNEPLKLPILELPEGMKEALNPMHGGFGNVFPDGLRWSNSVLVESNEAPDKLMPHFAKQLQQQGWSLDADWHSQTVAGGIWRKADELNRPLLGQLQVLKIKAKRLELSFSARIVD